MGPKHNINQYIKSDRIRLIDSDNNTHNIVYLHEALLLAEARNTDLVQISNDEIPIVKLIDYDKFLYQLDKSKKHQSSKKLKQINLTPNITDHDLSYKIRQINTWLADGSKVQITLRFSGRENRHKEFGREVLNKIITNTSEISKLEAPIKENGNIYIMLLCKK